MRIRHRFTRLPRFLAVAILGLSSLYPGVVQGLSDGTPATVTNSRFGTGFNTPPADAALQPDGKVIVVGGFTSYNGVAVPGIVRLNTDGSVDSAFNTAVGSGATGAGIGVVELQTDGKIIIGGTFNTWNGTSAGRITRLNANGSLDTTFNSNIGSGISAGVGSSAGAMPMDFEVQPDGKILVVGDFTQFQSSMQEFVLRLNSNGTADTTFNSNVASIVDIYMFDVALQSTGHIVITGGNIGAGGVTNAGIIRFSSTGILDAAFSTAVGTGAAAVAGGFTSTATVLSDNSIIVGGKFSQFGNSTGDALAKLSASGTIDTTFGTSLTAGIAGNMSVTPYQSMSEILLQSDNSLLIGGCFLTMNGVSSPGVARITTAGQVDSSFGSKLGTGFNGCIRAMLAMPDGTVLTIGDFTTLNGAIANGIASLGVSVPASTTTSTTTTAPPATSTTTPPASSTQRSLPTTGSMASLWAAFSFVMLMSGIALLRLRNTNN